MGCRCPCEASGMGWAPEEGRAEQLLSAPGRPPCSGRDHPRRTHQLAAPSRLRQQPLFWEMDLVMEQLS